MSDTTLTTGRNPRRPQPTTLSWRLQPLTALRALRSLLRDKEDTGQVFQIMRALNGKSTAKGYVRLLNTPMGGAMAFKGEELAPLLDDDATMAAMPAGSLGAAYFAWRCNEGLSAAGLAEVARSALGQQEPLVAHPYAWFGRRTRDVHDLWHVLNGYGRDGLGEASLVAFSFAQTGGLGWGLIAVGAAVQGLLRGAPDSVGAIFEGWRRGRRAAWLLGEDYPALLAEPLESARRRLNLTLPVRYQAVLARLAALGLDPDGAPVLATA